MSVVDPVGAGEDPALSTPNQQSLAARAQALVELASSAQNQALNKVAARTALAELGLPAPASTSTAPEDSVLISGRATVLIRLFVGEAVLPTLPQSLTPQLVGAPEVLGTPPLADSTEAIPATVADKVADKIADKYGVATPTTPQPGPPTGSGTAASTLPPTVKNLLAALVYQFLTQADIEMLGRLYEAAQSPASGLSLREVDAVAFEVASFRANPMLLDELAPILREEEAPLPVQLTEEAKAIVSRLVAALEEAPDPVLPTEWLKTLLNPAGQVRRPVVPVSMLEQLATILTAPAPADPPDVASVPQRAPTQPSAATAPIPQPRQPVVWEQAPLVSDEVVPLAAPLAARIDDLGELFAPFPTLGPSVNPAQPALQPLAQRMPGPTDAVASLVSLLRGEDARLLGTLYAGVEQRFGAESPQLQSVDQLARQMALMAAFVDLPQGKPAKKSRWKKALNLKPEKYEPNEYAEIREDDTYDDSDTLDQPEDKNKP